MKRVTLIPGVILFLSLLTYGMAPSAFSVSDVKSGIKGIAVEMDKEAVDKALGKPVKVTKQYEDAFGADVLTYFYDFGQLRLEPGDGTSYYVAKIFVNRPNVAGPRGIKVGMALSDLLSKFPYDKKAPLKKWGDVQVRYVYGTGPEGEDSGENYGCIEYDQTGKPQAVRYYCSYYYLCIDIKKEKVVSYAIGGQSN